MSALMMVAPTALAIDAEFDEADDVGQVFEETETDLSAELGGALAAGNTEFWTLNGLVSSGHRWQRNKLSGELGGNIGSSVVDGDGDGILSQPERDVGRARTAQRAWAEGRYDRFLGERDSVYALAGGLLDPFAGYDLRTHEQLGYSRLLVTSDKTNLVGELGFDYAQENYVDGIDPGYADIFAARVMLGLSHEFNDNVAFTDTVEVYENVVDLQDLRLLNEVALTTRLSGTFSVKLSHQLTFDNVPVTGFRTTDHMALATLVATLL